MSSELPKASATHKRGNGQRGTANAREERLLELRRLLRLRLREPEIAQKLGVSDRTIRFDLKVIQEQDRAWLSELARESFVTELRGSFEFIKDRERRLLIIEADESISAWTRVQASLGAANLELSALQAMKEGPELLSLRNQVLELEDKVREAKRSEIPDEPTLVS
jgi:hypothetical protein